MIWSRASVMLYEYSSRCLSRKSSVFCFFNKCWSYRYFGSFCHLFIFQSPSYFGAPSCWHLAVRNHYGSRKDRRRVHYPRTVSVASYEYSWSHAPCICRVLRQRFSISKSDAQQIVSKNPALMDVGMAMLRVHIDFMQEYGVSLEDLIRDVDVLAQPIDHLGYLVKLLDSVAEANPDLRLPFSQMYPMCRFSRGQLIKWKKHMLVHRSANVLTRLQHLLDCSLLTVVRICSETVFNLDKIPLEDIAARVAALGALGIGTEDLVSAPRLLTLPSPMLHYYTQQRQQARSYAQIGGATVSDPAGSDSVDCDDKPALITHLLNNLAYKKRFAKWFGNPDADEGRQLVSNQPREQKLEGVDNSAPSSPPEIPVSTADAHRQLPLNMLYADVFQFIADRYGVDRKLIAQRFTGNNEVHSITLARFEAVTELLISTGYTATDLLVALPCVYRYDVSRVRQRLASMAQLDELPSLHVINVSQRNFDRYMELAHQRQQKRRRANQSSVRDETLSSGSTTGEMT